MVFTKEYSTLVIVGFWNNAIFNPEWVAKYLFPNKQFNVDIAMNVNGSFRMSTDNLRLFVLDNRLQFVLLNHTNIALQELEDVARKVADYLPHTPVSSFGINFVIENEIQGHLDEICETKDTFAFEKIGYKLTEMSIKRQFVINDKLLNLTVNKGTNKLIFDFNYHFPIKTLIEFKEIFEEDILIDYKDKSIGLLSDVYKLEKNAN